MTVGLVHPALRRPYTGLTSPMRSGGKPDPPLVIRRDVGDVLTALNGRGSFSGGLHQMGARGNRT
jgi:hypothetical protein